MFNKGFTILFLSILVVGLKAQEENPFKVRSTIGLRYMSTHNRGDLEDFNAVVGFGQIKADYQLKPWLSFSGQLNGVFLPSTSGLEKRDATTGKGPLFESNLFNLRTMSGQSEFALPILNAQFNLEGHILTAGRFLRNVQAFHPEQWPFPNALEGIWYENYTAENTSWQLAYVHKAMPRFSGDFETIGNSIGVAGVGVNTDGSPSGYRNNVNSKALVVGNYNRLFNQNFSLDVWDYFVEGVMNTLLIEPSFYLPDGEWNLSLKTLIQSKIGEGGNADELLRYKTDRLALYLGFRVEKRLSSSVLQFNLTRITDDGRFLMPREWGYEPFYTFQKRNRIEGARDVIGLMMKWKKSWSDEKLKYQFSTSAGQNFMPEVTDYLRNKYQTPSTLNLDAELKVQPVKWMTGLTAEVLLVYRFLTDDSNIEDKHLINQADFLHTDIRLYYSF